MGFNEVESIKNPRIRSGIQNKIIGIAKGIKDFIIEEGVGGYVILKNRNRVGERRYELEISSNGFIIISSDVDRIFLSISPKKTCSLSEEQIKIILNGFIKAQIPNHLYEELCLDGTKERFRKKITGEVGEVFN